MAKKPREMSIDFFKTCYADALKIPFPVDDILPDKLKKKLQTLCIYYGTSIEMLMAALLPATACVLGPKTFVKTRNFGEDRVSVTSLYSIACGGPGSGKSVAFRMALQKPMEELENEAGKEWILKEFTKQGIMRQQDESEGKGCLASDEIAGTLTQCLLRSDSGVTSTGERQLLCSFWSGDGHAAKYATKNSRKVACSALSMAGFLQPDKLFQLMQALGSTDDGLLDRMLLWACRKKLYYTRDEEAAYETLQAEGGILSFRNVLGAINDQHTADSRTYCFTKEGYTSIRLFRDEIVRRQLEPKREEIADLPCVADRMYHTRYMDNLYRLSVNIHVLFFTIDMMLRGEPITQIPLEITDATLGKAKALLDYLTMQKAYIIHGALGVSFTEEPQECVQELARDFMYLDMMKRLMLKDGPAISLREAKRTASNKNIPSDVLFLRMQEDGMGTVVNVARSRIFFKTNNPSDAVLKLLAISRQMYNHYRTRPGQLTPAFLRQDPYQAVPEHERANTSSLKTAPSVSQSETDPRNQQSTSKLHSTKPKSSSFPKADPQQHKSTKSHSKKPRSDSPTIVNQDQHPATKSHLPTKSHSKKLKSDSPTIVSQDQYPATKSHPPTKSHSKKLKSDSPTCPHQHKSTKSHSTKVKSTSPLVVTPEDKSTKTHSTKSKPTTLSSTDQKQQKSNKTHSTKQKPTSPIPDAEQQKSKTHSTKQKPTSPIPDAEQQKSKTHSTKQKPTSPIPDAEQQKSNKTHSTKLSPNDQKRDNSNKTHSKKKKSSSLPNTNTSQHEATETQFPMPKSASLPTETNQSNRNKRPLSDAEDSNPKKKMHTESLVQERVSSSAPADLEDIPAGKICRQDTDKDPGSPTVSQMLSPASIIRESLSPASSLSNYAVRTSSPRSCPNSPHYCSSPSVSICNSTQSQSSSPRSSCDHPQSDSSQFLVCTSPQSASSPLSLTASPSRSDNGSPKSPISPQVERDGPEDQLPGQVDGIDPDMQFFAQLLDESFEWQSQTTS